MRILGIDPGLNTTGYGIVKVEADRLQAVTAGDIRCVRTRPVPERLTHLHRELTRLIRAFHPDVAVLEMVFTHQQYLTTASLMAHARGVACLTVQEHGLPLSEYPPAQVKKALTGRGAASKDQVARMVAQWLNQTVEGLSADATDALALAITHAHIGGQRARLALVGVS